MRNWNVVRVRDTARKTYAPSAKRYGILVQKLEQTGVINFDGNTSGLCINIRHGDYDIVPCDHWDIVNGEVVITAYGQWTETGLKIQY